MKTFFSKENPKKYQQKNFYSGYQRHRGKVSNAKQLKEEEQSKVGNSFSGELKPLRN